MPPSGPQSSAPPVDPESRTRETLRLMARRNLHGARGILYIAGSIMLVLSAGQFLSISGLLGFQPGPELEIQLAAAGAVVGLLVISCGWLVLRMPRTATILPIVLFAANIATALTLTLDRRLPPGLLSATLQAGLAVLTIKALLEAFAFHRDAGNIREAIRSAVILRNRDRGRAPKS